MGLLEISTGSAVGIVAIQGVGDGITSPNIQRLQVALKHNEVIGGFTGTAYGNSGAGLLRIDAVVSQSEIKRSQKESHPSPSASPTFIAIGRRRAFAHLQKQVLDLQIHAARDDFHTFTFPIASGARRELSKLMAHEQSEGNSCIVLRYLRNSFIGQESNDRYRDAEVAKAVAELLVTPATVDMVTFAYTRTVFKKLESLNLRTVAPMTWAAFTEDGDSDEEDEKEEVSN